MPKNSNGLTQRDMIVRLYTEMIGIDGTGGMRGDVGKLSTKLDGVEQEVREIRTDMVTEDMCKVLREADKNEDRRKNTCFWDRWPKIVGVVLVILGWTVAIWLAFR